MKSSYFGRCFKAYSVIDICSRKIVGYRVATREADDLAVEMFTDAFTTGGCAPGIIHADSGAVMRCSKLDELSTARGGGPVAFTTIRIQWQPVFRIGFPDDEVPEELPRFLS